MASLCSAASITKGFRVYSNIGVEECMEKCVRSIELSSSGIDGYLPMLLLSLGLLKYIFMILYMMYFL